MDKYFNDRFHYPVIIFHEADTRKYLLDITSWSKSYIIFQEITFKLPKFIPLDFIPEIQCPGRVDLGYNNMCRFHSKLVYEQPIMRILDYAWRLDDDSELLSPVETDVFQYMQQNDIEYGYHIIDEDNPKCVVGLWKAARQYVTSINITTQFFHQWEEPQLLFYNNFELSKVSFWLSEQYQEYIEHLDQLGGIYYHRWGDAPIKTIAISMFMPKRKLRNFRNISYGHKSYHNHRDFNLTGYWKHVLDKFNHRFEILV